MLLAEEKLGGEGDGRTTTHTNERQGQYSTLPDRSALLFALAYTSTISAFAAVLLIDWIPFLQAAFVVQLSPLAFG